MKTYLSLPRLRGGKKPFIALFLMLCITATACRAWRPAAESAATVDTVTVRIIQRDTAVVLQSDSALVRALLECDSTGAARLREVIELRNGRRVRAPDLSVRGDTLTVRGRVDSMAVYLKLTERFRDARREKTSVRTVEINRLSWWQSLWVGMGKAFALAVAGVAVFKVVKRKMIKR